MWRPKTVTQVISSYTNYILLMDQKDKHTVSHQGRGESSKKENMKRSLLGPCKAEVESTTADEATAAKSPSPMLRECNICGKVFSSGKALGGHRRSHFQKHQKKVKVRFTNHSSKAGDSSNINRANNCDYDADDDGKRICCICKKEFPTKNALFGHMRSHPERSWKGVSPPTRSPNKNSSSSSLSSYTFSSQNSDSMEKNMEEYRDDDYVDCVGGGGGNIVIIDLSTFTSPSWLKTDVRGRKCIGAYEAAETLTYLSAYSKYFCSESNRVSPKKDEVLSKSAPPLIKNGKRKVGESSSSKKHKVKKIKFYLNGELKIGKKNDGDGEFDDDEGEKLNRCKGLSKSGVGRILYMDDEVEEEEGVDEAFDDVITEVVAPAKVQDHVDERKVKRVVDHKGKNSKKLVMKFKAKDTEYENGGQEKEKVGGYKCGACGKKFSTFQGLGGHRSVHKEKNTEIMDESNRSKAVVADQEDNSSSSSNMHKVDEATMNEAPLPTDETTANEKAPLLADEACQSSPCTKKLDFDLNELPCGMKD
ncbi:hypothetical protein JHK85_036282 [Glycine max]|nr:hypothetical protein JHK85_036282 [Glycine max]